MGRNVLLLMGDLNIQNQVKDPKPLNGINKEYKEGGPCPPPLLFSFNFLNHNKPYET